MKAASKAMREMETILRKATRFVTGERKKIERKRRSKRRRR